MHEAEYANILRLVRERLHEHGLAQLDASIVSSGLSGRAAQPELPAHEALRAYLDLLQSKLASGAPEVTAETVRRLIDSGWSSASGDAEDLRQELSDQKPSNLQDGLEDV